MEWIWEGQRGSIGLELPGWRTLQHCPSTTGVGSYPLQYTAPQNTKVPPSSPAQCIIPPGHSLPHSCAPLSLSPARKPTQTLASSSRFVAVHWLRHPAPYLPVEAVPSLLSWPEVQEPFKISADDKNLWNLGSRAAAITHTFFTTFCVRGLVLPAEGDLLSCSCWKELTEAA